ncbi:FkbM family methyltransferase [Candidatus Marinamargulisbacteria bacterium SCGC AG-343-K17]|nr:FkbM family methyltransferase [Candidatus Marinamargulisbacteria bacterium SCGC AG-343-K17]
MTYSNKSISFILVSSDQGTMIVNRHDYNMSNGEAYGVGHQLLNHSSYDYPEVEFTKMLLNYKRKYNGDGVIAIDCGANIGVHTIQWGNLMHNWGTIYSFEAQEKIFYALAGNIVMNNCFNIHAFHKAVSFENGHLMIPKLDYTKSSSFGSFEIKKKESTEFIGQPIDYENDLISVPTITLDSLELDRLDLVKIDVEGMEIDVLTGAKQSIEQFKPILVIEFIKSDLTLLNEFLNSMDYKIIPMNSNIIALHSSDPLNDHIKVDNNVLSLDSI